MILFEGSSSSSLTPNSLPVLIIAFRSSGTLFRFALQDWRYMFLHSCGSMKLLLGVIMFFLIISSAMRVHLDLVGPSCRYVFSHVSCMALFLAVRSRSFLPPSALGGVSV